jgi:hypothetical protein
MLLPLLTVVLASLLHCPTFPVGRDQASQMRFG